MNLRKTLIIAFLSFGTFILYLWGIPTYRNNLIRSFWTLKLVFTRNSEIDSMFNDEAVSINRKTLVENENELSFFVVGHIYGDSDRSLYHPSIMLIKNVQKINEMNPDMMIMLGDIVAIPTEDEFADLNHYLFEPLSMPIFNAVGNHDVGLNRDAYVERYGKTIFSFVYKNYLFIFLDTTIEPCDLTNDQYDFISQKIDFAQSEYEIEGVNIFFHHVLFWDKTKSISEHSCVTNSDCMNQKEFATFIESKLSDVSEDIPVYIYAGDVGKKNGNLSPYYEKVSGKEIYMFATGLGNTDTDSILYVREVDGKLLVEPYALNGREMLDIDHYDYQYWMNKQDD